MIEADRDYRVVASEHGTILLEPVTVISDFEKRVLANDDLVAALDKALETPFENYVRTQRRSRTTDERVTAAFEQIRTEDAGLIDRLGS